MSNESAILDDVKHHPRVCSHCFSIRHDEDPVPAHIAELARRTEWAAAVTPAWTRDERNATIDAPPGKTVSEWHPRTRCECGNFSAYASIKRDPDDPLDKPTAVEFTANLSNTLDRLEREHEERGNGHKAERYAHDEDALFRAVKHLKSKPEYQFHDDRIFAAAVEVACRHGTHEPEQTPKP